MNIDPKLAYWTAALVDMAVIFGCALLGIRNVRRGRVAAHRRWMLAAGSLVLLFLVSYVGKVRFLGREDLHVWEPAYVWMLRFHETCVLVMLLAGSVALYLALRLRLDAPARDPGEDAARFAARVRVHRRAGWTAVVATSLGVASAAVVLWGMYARI